MNTNKTIIMNSIDNKKQPAISVVMPVYNMAQYVSEAIESILGQTFSDFELIIIDDGSTDKTVEIIKEYRDPRIILILNSKNKGNYPCRNEGISIAKGKYIAIMDADDICLPERLIIQYEYLENHNNLLAIGANFIFCKEEKYSRYFLNNPVSYEQVKYKLLFNNCFLHSSIMIRTEILCNLDGYNISYIYAADYDLICRIVNVGEVAIIPDILVKYRCHNEQISNAHFIEQQKYANKIRQKYHLSLIKQLNLPGLFPDQSAIAFSKMGIIIYLYNKAKTSNEQITEYKADELLEDLLNNLSTSIPVCMEEGLCGLGCGLLYLLRNGFVDGEEDIILEDIDKAIRYAIINGKNVETSWSYGLCGWFNYLVLRVENISNSSKRQYNYNIKSLTLLIDLLGKVHIPDDSDKEMLNKCILKLLQITSALPI